MTPEYEREFIAAADRGRFLIAVVTNAALNLSPVNQKSEQETLAFMARSDVVFAVWFEPRLDSFQMKKLKGPEIVPDGMPYNAFAVADAADAEHWRDLFEEKATPRRAPKPRLVASEGTSR